MASIKKVNLDKTNLQTHHFVGAHPYSGTPASDQSGIAIDPVGGSSAGKTPTPPPISNGMLQKKPAPPKGSPIGGGKPAGQAGDGALYGPSKATNRNPVAKPEGKFPQEND